MMLLDDTLLNIGGYGALILWLHMRLNRVESKLEGNHEKKGKKG